MKTRYENSDSASNKLAGWKRSVIDRRFWFFMIFDPFFSQNPDGWAVTDDFGNLVQVTK